MQMISALVPMAASAADQLISVGGLPLHPLAVHAVVVLLPLGILGLFAIVFRPRWRAAYAKLVMAALVLGTGATIVAVQAGEQLALVTGISEEHERLGKLLGIVAVLLTVSALAWWWPIRRPSAAQQRPFGGGSNPWTGGAAVVLGATALILSALVGHSGATAVWQDRIATKSAAASASASASAAPSATKSATKKATASASASAGTYTLSQVAKHNSAADCWTVINGNAYNVTQWINVHPGGPVVIQGLCGNDGSAAFTGQHGGQGGPASQLSQFLLGPVK